MVLLLPIDEVKRDIILLPNQSTIFIVGVILQDVNNFIFEKIKTREKLTNLVEDLKKDQP